MRLSDAGKVTRRLRQFWARHDEARRLAPLYSPNPGDLDRDRHLAEAVEWVRRAQDAGPDRGVAYGAALGSDFDVSYPETTGYICQTFVDLERATGNAELLDRAIEMGDWEIEIQMESGAVMGGKCSNAAQTPAVFNTGMVLLGWAALFNRTRAERFQLATRRAANWLADIQEPNGDWIQGRSRFAMDGTGVYRVMAAWGLCEAGIALGDDRYIDGAIRNAEFCLSRQQPNGWLADCCLSDPSRPLLHTLAYAMQGLVAIGRLTGREDFIAGAQRLADAELRIMTRGGFLAGRQDSSFRPAAKWACVTGTAQTSIVWSELLAITGDDKYRTAVARANRWLMAHHDIRNPDERLRGGITGSWPVQGGYRRLEVINWGVKFFIDALAREQQDATYIADEISAHRELVMT